MYIKAVVKDHKGNIEEIAAKNPIEPLPPDPYDEAAVALYRSAVLELTTKFSFKLPKLVFSRKKIEEIQTDSFEIATMLHKMGFGDKVKVIPEGGSSEMQ